jgi:hypothetical protein
VVVGGQGAFNGVLETEAFTKIGLRHTSI